MVGKLEKIIRFKPHHFMCSLNFRGKGYSPSFIANYKDIMRTLNGNEDAQIRVTFESDDICNACPNKINNSLCNKQEKITKLDARHSGALHPASGDIISWKEGKVRIKKYMSIKKFHTICKDCSWKEYGICESSLKEFLDSEENE